AIDYTMTWLRPQRVAAPLATIGAPADPNPGALGQEGTVVIFGDRNIDFGMLSGVKGEVGLFIDCEDHWSLEAAGMYAFPTHVHFRQQSDANGSPIITRPFFNVVTEKQAAFADSLPGIFAGSFNADARSQFVSAEFNIRNHDYGAKRLHA